MHTDTDQTGAVRARLADRVVEARVYRLAERDRVTSVSYGAGQLVPSQDLAPLEVGRAFSTSYPAHETGRGDVETIIVPDDAAAMLAECFGFDAAEDDREAGDR